MDHDGYWIEKIVQDKSTHKDSNLETNLPINVWEDCVCDSYKECSE